MRAPLEIYGERVWEVLDPNTAQLVAIFYDAAAAYEYVKWRNGTSSAGQSPFADAKQESPPEEKSSATTVRPADANTFCVADSTSPPSTARPDGPMEFRGEQA